jgi:hypothetical protein
MGFCEENVKSRNLGETFSYPEGPQIFIQLMVEEMVSS